MHYFSKSPLSLPLLHTSCTRNRSFIEFIFFFFFFLARSFCFHVCRFFFFCCCCVVVLTFRRSRSGSTSLTLSRKAWKGACEIKTTHRQDIKSQ